MYKYMKVMLSAVKYYIDKIAANINAKIPVKTSQLENDENYATEEYVDENKTIIDSTLSIEGQAADSKIVGDRLAPFGTLPLSSIAMMMNETDVTRVKIDLKQFYGTSQTNVYYIDKQYLLVKFYYGSQFIHSVYYPAWIRLQIASSLANDISADYHDITLEADNLKIIVNWRDNAIFKKSVNQTVYNNDVLYYANRNSNHESYIPTEDYHLSTKKYVDDSSSSISNEISNTYETKEDASAKLEEAKGYADQVKSDILGGAPKETLDTIIELATAFEENAGVVEAINQAITDKADKSNAETWTFTLANGSTVTKKVVLA